MHYHPTVHWMSPPPGWVLSMPPVYPPWISCASTCPCTSSAGLSCAATSHKKESSRRRAPTTSTWPCCWSSSSCPPCLPSTPSSPSLRLSTVDRSGKLSVQAGFHSGCISHPPCLLCYLSFSGKNRMFDVIHETLESDFPAWFSKVFSYASNPGLVLPFILLMMWVNEHWLSHALLSVCHHFLSIIQKRKKSGCFFCQSRVILLFICWVFCILLTFISSYITFFFLRYRLFVNAFSWGF